MERVPGGAERRGGEGGGGGRGGKVLPVPPSTDTWRSVVLQCGRAGREGWLSVQPAEGVQ